MGWVGKGSISFNGAFREAKHEKTQRGEKEGGQKFPFPQPLSFFVRPSLKVFQNSAFGFSLKKVRISFSVRSKQKNTDLNQYFFVCSR
jgi:hypothetical protein